MRRAACILALIAPAASAQTTTLVSVDSGGAQGNGASIFAAVSADARYVVFGSAATNLVAGDTNGWYDVFRRDRQTSATVRVSVATGGAQANLHSFWPDVSSDGRWIVFESIASNLVPGDANGVSDVFEHDAQTGTTLLVSVAIGGGPGSNISGRPAVSANGRWVSFGSFASDLVPGDLNGTNDVFVRDVQAGTTQLVSVSTTGGPANGPSMLSDISDDGRYVVFASAASNLVLGDTNGKSDVFLRDLQLGMTQRVSVDTLGGEGDGDSDYPAISGDGRIVAWSSTATNLVPGDVNGVDDVFVRDTQTGLTTVASLSSLGAWGNLQSSEPKLSTDGRWVAFSTVANNLVANDTNGTRDVLLRDRASGTTALVSARPNGFSGNGMTSYCAVGQDGRWVAFSSVASDLVGTDANGADDAFVRDRGAAVPPQGFCGGDGTGGLCPCGNTSTPGSREGCRNSLGAGGKLIAEGNANVSADTLVLRGSGMPNGSALYFQGTALQNGDQGAQFGDGLRCAGGSVIRLGTKFNVAGASQYPETGDQAVSVRGQVTASGTRVYQIWYRNAATFCTASTFNLTNGVLVTWTAPCPTC